MYFFLVRIYACLYGFAKDRIGIHLPGLGFALRRVRSDRIVHVQGCRIYFNYKVGASYARIIAGKWNEEETHVFLDSVLSKSSEDVVFVDVGANIGEMVVDVARKKNVKEIVAFEPIGECHRAIRKSLEINEIKNCRVLEMLVGEKVGNIGFHADDNPHVSSVLSRESRNTAHKLPMTTLDDSVPVPSEALILLIDVEGYELMVLKGGERLIREKRPLIVFEYCSGDDGRHSLADFESLLGSQYTIYRLRQDGRLDGDVAHAWNCVAVARGSMFEAAVYPLLVD